MTSYPRDSSDKVASYPLLPGKRRPGFVLLLVLAAVAVVGLWSAAVARTTLEVVSLASQTQRELQLRWTRASLQQSLGNRLAMAPELMAQGYWTGHLGGRPLELRLADERRKTSLPALYAASGQAAVLEAIRNAAPWKAKPIILPQPDRPPLWANWGDVWDLTSMSREQLVRDLPQVTRSVSLWSGHTSSDFTEPGPTPQDSARPARVQRLSAHSDWAQSDSSGSKSLTASGPPCFSCWFRSGSTLEFWILEADSTGRTRAKTFVW
jgi:hypothetical protein